MEQDQRKDKSFGSLMDPRGPPEGKNPFFTAVSCRFQNASRFQELEVDQLVDCGSPWYVLVD